MQGVSLRFLGAARTVTGSKYLLESGSSRILVDAGLFQGLKDLRLRNWADFPVPPSSLDAIVLTHAHLDHCGYLPRLVMQGFRGRVFCTAGTRDLCRIVLPDAGRIQEAEGTRGRHLLNGVESVKIHGAHVPVRARIERIDSISAHADSSEILRWLGGFERPPAMTCLVHGEPGAMSALASSIERALGWPVHLPALGEAVALTVEEMR